MSPSVNCKNRCTPRTEGGTLDPIPGTEDLSSRILDRRAWTLDHQMWLSGLYMLNVVKPFDAVFCILPLHVTIVL